MSRRLGATAGIMLTWATLWSIAGLGFGALATIDAHRSATPAAWLIFAGFYGACGAVGAALFAEMLSRSPATDISELRGSRVAALGAAATGGLAAALVLMLGVTDVLDNAWGPALFILTAAALGALTATAMLAIARRERSAA